MRTLLTVILFILWSGALAGQSAEEETIRLKQQDVLTVEGTGPSGPDEVTDDDGIQAEKEQKKGNLGLSVGTAYSFSKGYGSGVSFYAAPAYTVPLNNRWSLHAGFVAWHYQGLNGFPYGESLAPMQFSSLAVFAAASYRMNERLVLHGAGMKRLVSAPVTPLTAFPMDNISLGATYHLGNNITIGATLHINNGYGMYSHPYQGFGPNPPFIW